MAGIKEDDIVFCEVKKIEGTTVFLKIENGISGSMILSEVAPGRIRNLREYVVPGKKVVCKVLKVYPDHVELSLRRVTAKEKQIVLNKYKKERALANIFKLGGEDGEKIISKIKEDYDINDFLEKIKTNKKILEKYVRKDNIEKILKAISEKVEKEKVVVKKISLRTLNEGGIFDIKNILNIKNVEISYLGSGNFLLRVRAKDFKEANHEMQNVLNEIESRSKKLKVFFEILKEK